MNKNIKSIIIFFLVSIFIALGYEIYLNKNLIRKNNKYFPEIVSITNFEKNGDTYISTSKKSYIIFKLNESSYINKIKFNYESNRDFGWDIIYNINKTKEKRSNSSSKLITSATRIVDRTTDEVKLVINQKNVKISNIEVDNRIDFNFLRFTLVFASIFMICIFIDNKKYFYNNLDKAFLILAVVYGIFMIFSTPKVIGQSFDDNTHLKNSIAFLSKESFKAQKAYLINESIGLGSTRFFKTSEEYNEYYKILNNEENSKYVDVQVNDYSPKFTKFIYLPYYIGFKVSNIMNLNYTNSLLVSRVFNYFVYVLIMFLAIKYSTYAKKIIFLLALTPTRIYYGVQFSYDPLIISSFILAFALFLRMIEDEKLNYKYVVAFILLTVWASLPKAVYAPYLLLLLFIPSSKFNSKKQSKNFKICIMAIEMLLVSTFLLPIVMNTASGDIRGGDVSVSGQLKFISGNLVNFSIMMVKYIYQTMPGMMLGSFQFFGLGYLYSTANNISGTFYLIYLICMLYFAFTENITEKMLSKKYKILFILFILIFMIGIPFTMYLVYVSVGDMKIGGVQQRYFYQLLLPLFVLLFQYNNAKSDNNKIALFIVPILTLLFSIAAMIINIPLI